MGVRAAEGAGPASPGRAESIGCDARLLAEDLRAFGGGRNALLEAPEGAFPRELAHRGNEVSTRVRRERAGGSQESERDALRGAQRDVTQRMLRSERHRS